MTGLNTFGGMKYATLDMNSRNLMLALLHHIRLILRPSWNANVPRMLSHCEDRAGLVTVWPSGLFLGSQVVARRNAGIPRKDGRSGHGIGSRNHISSSRNA